MTSLTFVSNGECACYLMAGFFLLATSNKISVSETSTATMLTISGVLDEVGFGVAPRVAGVDCLAGDGVETSDAGLTLSVSRSSGVGIPCGM